MKKTKVLKDSKVLTPTWAMKPKPNGIKQARLTACGFEQVDSSHFDSQDLLVLVVNGISLVFDTLDTLRWLRGEREVPGHG